VRRSTSCVLKGITPERFTWSRLIVHRRGLAHAITPINRGWSTTCPAASRDVAFRLFVLEESLPMRERHSLETRVNTERAKEVADVIPYRTRSICRQDASLGTHTPSTNAV
jgi:hypothetical protein